MLGDRRRGSRHSGRGVSRWHGPGRLVPARSRPLREHVREKGRWRGIRLRRTRRELRRWLAARALLVPVRARFIRAQNEVMLGKMPRILWGIGAGICIEGWGRRRIRGHALRRGRGRRRRRISQNDEPRGGGKGRVSLRPPPRYSGLCVWLRAGQCCLEGLLDYHLSASVARSRGENTAHLGMLHMHVSP